MNALGVYKVTGQRAYRGHKPGDVFEATLDPDAEARAVARGSIAVLDRLDADLPAGKFRLPTGWPMSAATGRK